MRLFNSTTFAALLLAGSMVACTVGDTSVGVPTPEGADAGQNVVANDAAPIAELKWTPTTVDQLGIKAAMHYVSPTEIYAIVGEKVCMWNGTAWVDHTLPAIGLATTMHFVTPTQIYSVIGNRVAMWNGTAWVDMSLNIAGINDGVGSAAIHWVSDTEIYAVIINGLLEGRIAMYNGNAWVDMTEPMLGMRYAFDVVPGAVAPDVMFYALIGNTIQKATPALGVLLAPWTPLAPEQLGLRTAIQAVSDTEIYAVIDEKVCKFDGLAWADITLDVANLRTAFVHTTDDDIMAIAGSAVTHWAPVVSP